MGITMNKDEFLKLTHEMMIEMINGLSDHQFISVHNELAYPDDHIFSMDDFNDIFSGYDPIDIVCRVFYGNFNPNDDYFQFNGYGNLESFRYLGDIKSRFIDDIDSFDDDQMAILIDEITANQTEGSQ